jgi:hypothetical protein
MKNPTYFLLIVLTSLSVLLSACNSAPKIVQQPLPQWVNTKPQDTPKQLYFVGSSGQKTDEKAAYQAARHSALTQFAEYCGTEVDQNILSLITSSQEHFKQQDEIQSHIKTSANISRAQVRKQHNQSTQNGYQAYVLISFPQTEVSRVKNRQRVKGIKQSLKDSHQQAAVPALQAITQALIALDDVDFTDLDDNPKSLSEQLTSRQRALQALIKTQFWSAAVLETPKAFEKALTKQLQDRHPSLLILPCRNTADCLQKAADAGSKQLTLLHTAQQLTTNSMGLTQADIGLTVSHHSLCHQRIVDTHKRSAKIFAIGKKKLDWGQASEKILPSLSHYSEDKLTCGL